MADNPFVRHKTRPLNPQRPKNSDAGVPQLATNKATTSDKKEIDNLADGIKLIEINPPKIRIPAFSDGPKFTNYLKEKKESVISRMKILDQPEKLKGNPIRKNKYSKLEKKLAKEEGLNRLRFWGKTPPSSPIQSANLEINCPTPFEINKALAELLIPNNLKSYPIQTPLRFTKK